MEIEIVEFYPFGRDDSKGNIAGTLHVYITDLAMDLRGVFVKKRKNYWHFGLPHINGRDENGDPVRYPTVIFTDDAKNKNLIAAIREKGKAYIEENVLNKTKKACA